MARNNLRTFFLLITIAFAMSGVLIAQDETVSTAPPPPPVRITSGIGAGRNKVPGATVRGRLVYEDTGAPIRYAMVGFSSTGSQGSVSELVKTDENGNFVFEDLAAGEYYPVVRNRGILNPESFRFFPFDQKTRKEKLDSIFQKIAVPGQGEFDIFLRAKRGATISGVIRYFDGEPAVGVSVEAIPVVDGFSTASATTVYRGPNNPNSEKTDDRGFYRFAGLPEGQYLVRVTEPVSHRNTKESPYSSFSSGSVGESPFQTFFPNETSANRAARLEAFYGQTTEGVNITLPERTLYDISGVVIQKDTRQPLKNFEVTFAPIADEDEEEETGSNKTRMKRLISAFRGSSGSYNYGNEKPAEWSIINLPEGRYRLTATQQRRYTGGKDVESRSNEETNRYPRVSKEVEIRGVDLENIQIEIPVGGGLSGVIVAEEGVALNSYVALTAIEEESGTIARSNFVSDEGDEMTPINLKKFEFGRLTAGKYKLNLVGSNLYLREIAIGGKMVADGEIEVEDGEEVTNIRVFVASDLGTIRGSVRNFESGTQVAVMAFISGQDIVSSIAGRNGRSAGVKPNGTFEMKAAPGEYKLVVVTRNEMPRDPDEFLTWIEEQRAGGTTVTIGAKEIKTVILDLP